MATVARRGSVPGGEHVDPFDRTKGDWEFDSNSRSYCFVAYIESYVKVEVNYSSLSPETPTKPAHGIQDSPTSVALLKDFDV